jgi:hypothetical protein
MAQDISQTVFTDFARKAATLSADVVVRDGSATTP